MWGYVTYKTGGKENCRCGPHWISVRETSTECGLVMIWLTIPEVDLFQLYWKYIVPEQWKFKRNIHMLARYFTKFSACRNRNSKRKGRCQGTGNTIERKQWKQVTWFALRFPYFLNFHEWSWNWIAMNFIFFLFKRAFRFNFFTFLFMLLERFIILLVASFTAAQTPKNSLVVVNCTWPCANSSDVCILTNDNIRCNLSEPHQYVKLWNNIGSV